MYTGLNRPVVNIYSLFKHLRQTNDGDMGVLIPIK